MRACVRACMCVCGLRVQWFVQSISNRNIADSSFFSSISGWLPAAKCVCLSMSVLWEKIELSLAKNSHWELRGARPGSPTVGVNSISFAT